MSSEDRGELEELAGPYLTTFAEAWLMEWHAPSLSCCALSPRGSKHRVDRVLHSSCGEWIEWHPHWKPALQLSGK